MMAGVGQDNERTLAVMSDVNREIFVDPPPKKVPTKESFLCCFAGNRSMFTVCMHFCPVSL